MKKRLGKKGLTLVEVILSIAIFAAVALPLYSIFNNSVKTDRAASDILNANYIAQDYIEKLDTSTYYSALNNLPVKTQKGSYYLTAAILPYGTANSMFSGQCSYAHLVMFSNGSMLAVMPDGKFQLFGSVASSMSIGLSGSSYTFSCGGSTITGTSSYDSCALIINTMQKPSATTSSVTLGSGCKALVYCNKSHTGDISITGIKQIFENIISGTTSLVHVSASVFATAASTSAASTSESYINIKNW
jgi:prepilin-type N-terminal cleavage/methylation domain-containing protein